jgi:hypothetical protein
VDETHSFLKNANEWGTRRVPGPPCQWHRCLAAKVKDKVRCNVKKSYLRFLDVTVRLLFFAMALQPAKTHAQLNREASCINQRKGVPQSYLVAVLAQINPPGWDQGLVKITMGAERKLALWTDGEKFRLWMDSPELPQKSISAFLRDLDESCHLPSNPLDAAALIRVTWESTELSAVEFSRIHHSLMSALSQYVDKVRDRYNSITETRLIPIYVDSSSYRIVYDNHFEHIEIEAWNVSEPTEENLLIKWAHDLQKLAQGSFRKPGGLPAR